MSKSKNKADHERSNSGSADQLYKKIDRELSETVEEQYFLPPREFKSLVEVLAVVGERIDQFVEETSRGGDENSLVNALKDQNPAYNNLLYQKEVIDGAIEDVVKFQNGGLNASLETMTEVIKEYNKSKDDVHTLRTSLKETKTVLSAKKTDQITLKSLWSKKVEMVETMRILRDLEVLKDAPSRVQQLIDHRRYLTAVTTLNRAFDIMWGEDIVAVGAVSAIREQLMDLKERLIETVVSELKEAVLGRLLEVPLSHLL